MNKRLCVAVVLGVSLCGCPVSLCTVVLGTAQITLQKPADSWLATESGGETVLLFTCPSGIGSAVIELPAEFAPCRFNVGLRYGPGDPFTRLEGFQVAAGDQDFSDPPRMDGPLYLEVEIPDEVFDAGVTTLTIHWVDMYRF